MRTLRLNSTDSVQAYAAPSFPMQTGGGITELRYSEKPGMMQMLLLPLLQQLSHQSRWQLWLTPAHKLNRAWLQQSGLPLEKSMHVAESSRYSAVETMIKALRTGNYSVVLAWIPYELNEHERGELENAAAEGDALGLIMRAGRGELASTRLQTLQKIPSDLFH